MPLFTRFFRNLDLPGGLVFVLTAFVYILLFSHRTLLDITAQVQTLLKVCEGTVALPPMFLFYLLVWLAAFGQCDFVLCMGAAVVVLAGLATAKWWATRHIFEDYFKSKAAPDARHSMSNFQNPTPKRRTFGWLALALAFVCSLPTQDWWARGWYIIGQPSPNYWMNGTVLASWPFALMLFWESYGQLRRVEHSPDSTLAWCGRMLLWLFLLIISKPSYALVFVAVYPLFWVGRRGFGRGFWMQMLALLLFAAMLMAEHHLVFLQPESVYVKEFNRGEASGVALRPFHVWRLWSSNIPLSILAGVAFPAFVAAAFWQDLRQRLLFWYAWAGFFAAIFIYILFAQKGEEHYTAAFRFQNYIAAHILFVVSALFVWEKIRTPDPRSSRRVKWAVGLFLLHLLSGLIYLGKMWWTRSHY